MRNEVLQGDALTVLPTLAAGSVHCCITSPPYWGLRDYGLPPTDWPAVTFTPAAGLPELTIEPMTCCLGLEPEPWAFVGHLVLVFREVRRVLRGDGTCWVNLGDSYNSNASNQQNGQVDRPSSQGRYRDMGRYNKQIASLKPKDLIGIPWMCAKALQADGWWLRSDIIWYKVNPMPESVTDRPTSAHEHVFLLTKSARYFYDAEAVREPLKESSITRISQSTFNQQTGGPKDPRNGGEGSRNRSARQGLENLKDAHERGQGRNRRTVWTIATQPFSGAHFATFPPKLVEPCILAGTSARGCCPACGAGWARVVERGELEGPGYDNYKLPKAQAAAGTNIKGRSEGWYPNHTKPTTTTGWRPTCDCPEADPVPALVLDPFFGSGTVGAVAVEAGRDYVGIELNPEYIELSRKRLAGAQPALFAKGMESN